MIGSAPWRAPEWKLNVQNFSKHAPPPRIGPAGSRGGGHIASTGARGPRLNPSRSRNLPRLMSASKQTVGNTLKLTSLLAHLS